MNRAASLLVPLLAATLTGCGSSPAAPPVGYTNPAFSLLRDPSSAPEPVRAASRGVVRVTSSQGGGSLLFGTGFFISAEGMLLTNNHVVGVESCAREGCTVTLDFDLAQGETTRSVSAWLVPVHLDTGLDLAAYQAYEGDRVHRLSSPAYLTLRSRSSAELLGTSISVVGHPAGHLKKWSTGQVIDTEGDWFESNAFELEGSSGSPVLDEDGAVVGILHRGSFWGGSLTRTGAVSLTKASASAGMERMLQRSLPDPGVNDLLVSVLADTTIEQVSAHPLPYFNQGVTTVSIGGKQRSIVEVLGESCDQATQRSAYESPDALSNALASCEVAFLWFDCNSKSPLPPAACPAEPDRTLWSTRIQAAFERRRTYNGQLSFEDVSFLPAELSLEPLATARAGLTAVMTGAAAPPLDARLAYYCLVLGQSNCAGSDPVQYLLDYRAIPGYSEQLTWVAYGYYHLASVTGTEGFRDRLSRLAGDPELQLGDALAIEELLYLLP